MKYGHFGTAPGRESAVVLEQAVEARSCLLAERISLHLSLFKVGILGGVVASALLGAFLVSSEPPRVHTLLFLLLGTALSYAGAAAWNQVLEVPYDKQMDRTKDRPLPSGKLSVRYAVIIGSLLTVIGTALLYFCVSPLTGFLSIGAFFLYVFLYTALKRVGWYGTLIGTIPGALPAVGGAVSADQANFVVVVALFFLMVFWQLPHFYSYLWEVREDYQRAGFHMLPYAAPNGLLLMKGLVLMGAVVTFICTAVLSFFSPALTIFTGSIATGGALYLLVQTHYFISGPNQRSSKRLFHSTIYFIAYFTCVAGLSACVWKVINAT